MSTAPLAAGAVDPAQAVRNQLTNQIAVSGRGSASTGAAVSTAQETMIPLTSVTRYDFGTTPLAVNHQGLFVASTISFNLAPGKTLSDAVTYVNETMREIGPPSTIHGSFPGTARAFRFAQQSAPDRAGCPRCRLHRARRALRELHPPAHDPVDPAVGRRRRGARADADGYRVQHHRLIGVILLIGIVKKNAIMMIDFALVAEREGRDSAARGDPPGGDCCASARS